MYDVVLVGTGVVGALTARELTRYNLSVCLVEKSSDVSAGATKANSGIVHAGFDAKPNSKKATLYSKEAKPDSKETTKTSTTSTSNSKKATTTQKETTADSKKGSAM